MNGCEAFKYYREQNNYSLRQFAALSQVSLKMVSYYESGERLITSMPVFKAHVMFGLLGVDIETYIEEYFPYKSNLDAKITEWRLDNPRLMEYDILKKRIYLRLAKIKERKKIPADILDSVYIQYQKVFQYLLSRINDQRCISESDYEKYILPLQYSIKKGMHQEESESISNMISEAILKSEYTVSDIAEFCGISFQHLKRCVNGTYDFRRMHVDTALKLCYVLGLDFKAVFSPQDGPEYIKENS